jgi:hypothetical protein
VILVRKCCHRHLFVASKVRHEGNGKSVEDSGQQAEPDSENDESWGPARETAGEEAHLPEKKKKKEEEGEEQNNTE